jgi:flagellar biosynthesis protein FlhF
VERAGGIEQLSAFTRLLKLKLLEIEDAHALRDAVSLNKNKSLMIIDTSGRSPYSEKERQQLQQLTACVGGEAILVLPAGLDAAEATELAQEFRTLGATRLLLTRLDITRRLGSILAVAYQSKLPICGANFSNNVTEPLQPLNPVSMAKLLLPQTARAQQSKPKSTGTHA